jgi:ABC-2 type transport system ATP-binding protein
MSLIDLRYTQPPMVPRPCYDRWSRRGHPARRAAAQSKRVLLVRPSGRRNEPIRVTDEVSTVFAVPAVQVNNLRKEFIRRDGGSRKRGRRRRVAALQGLSFTMQRGECLAILGQNGSGKSTLVRLLSTLLINDGGSAHVFGIDVFDKPRSVQRLVNRVSVEASFFKRMSPMENLSYSARFYGMGPRETRARIPEILALVGFPPERGHEPMEDLSRGMQQKIALARALLTAPVLLLLDEPTTGLDPRSKLEVQDFIRQMREHHDSTILLCTHDMAEAEALADRIGILHRGELLCLESAEEIRQRYHADTLEQAFLNATGRSFEDEDEESRRGVPA